MDIPLKGSIPVMRKNEVNKKITSWYDMSVLKPGSEKDKTYIPGGLQYEL
ncbi:hypothetical protein (plasmid) [Metabacillus dongyingensis]|nr:hypothetical protein [Metabacillus dongyingensis]